jgi:hypothetical protein
MKKLSYVFSMAMFAMLGFVATPASAQCSGGGCGTGGSSAGTGGSCPSGGCGGAGGSAPTGGKVGRVDGPRGGNGGARGPVAADPEGIPAWDKPSKSAIETAAADQKPIVLYFPSEGATDHEFHGKDLAAISQTDAVFMKMPFTADREASPWATDSIVPASKLLSDNPARDYNVPVGKATVVVCDWFGNEYFRTDAKVKAPALKTMIDKVAKQVEDMDKKLQKNLEKANEMVAKADRKGALKLLVRNFNEGVVGIGAQEESIRTYHAIMDEVRSEVAKAASDGDTATLKALARDFKKTDVEKEISEALKNVG